MTDEIVYKPVYLQIADVLKQEILQGDFRPGSRFYSEAKLCQRFPVAHITIRNALRCLQEQGLIERIHGKGTFVSPGRMSRGTVGLLVWKGRETLRHPVFSEVVQGVSEVFGDAGYNCNLLFVTPEILNSGRVHQFILSSEVDGLIVPLQQITEEHLLPLRDKMKIVLIEQTMPAVTPYSISYDTGHGYYLAAEHLLRQGHERIGLIYSGSCKYKNASILQGFNRALSEWNIACVPELVRKSAVHTEEAGRKEAESLFGLNQCPTAVIAGDDFMALGVMRAAADKGLKIPEDVSVIGYNDMPGTADTVPPLTSVRLCYHLLGHRSAEMMVALLSRKKVAEENIVLRPELIIRSSTCRCRQREAVLS